MTQPTNRDEEKEPPKTIDEAVERCDAVKNPEWDKLSHEEKVARNMCFWMEKYFEERRIRREFENIYQSAVKGRMDFRSALAAERKRAGKLVIAMGQFLDATSHYPRSSGKNPNPNLDEYRCKAEQALAEYERVE